MSDAPHGHVGVPEAMLLLRVSRQRVYQLIAMGRLPAKRGTGRRVWVPLQAIEARLAGEERLDSRDCLTTAEVAEFFGVDERTVREWRVSNLLPAVQINNQLCFNPADVVAFVPPQARGPGRPPGHRAKRTIDGIYYPPPATNRERKPK